MGQPTSIPMETKVGTLGGALGGTVYGFFNFIVTRAFWADFAMAMFTAFTGAIVAYLGTMFIKWLIKIIKGK